MILAPPGLSASAPDLLIVGASTRAAAFSALRAGFTPVCIDQFADADLQAVSTVVRVGRDPNEFVKAAGKLPMLPVIYTGGLENNPDVVERLCEDRPLWGMPASTVQAIRDPLGVSAALAGSRLPCLETRSAEEPPDADGCWMLKPLRSAGGQGITIWDQAAAGAPVLSGPHYFQRRMEGLSYSGVFIAQSTVGDVRFVGLTEQLIGEAALNGGSFSWCGNIGPVALSISVESTVRRIANFLKWKFQLRGLFGIDFVVSPDGEVGVTEINPRYPASVEILEFATGSALLADHAACFAEGLEATDVDWTPLPGRVLGKAVFYSPRKLTVTTNLPFEGEGFRTWPRHADVPANGTVVQSGEPVLTLLVEAATAAECRSELFERAAKLLGAS